MPPTHPTPGTGSVTVVVAAGAAALLLVAVVLHGVVSGVLGSRTACRHQPATSGVSDAIPTDYLRLYQQAGRKFGVSWNVLAAVGKVETDHGRLDAPGVHDGTNAAGAAGPMQFLRTTWQTYGIDGNNDGRQDVYNPTDAIPAAARYLKDHGAPGRLGHALFAYNHSAAYVQTVLDWANTYAEGDATAPLAAISPACSTVTSAEYDGTVGEIIGYARAQLGKPSNGAPKAPTPSTAPDSS